VDLSLLASTQFNRRGMIQNERGVLQGEVKTRLPVVWGGSLQFKTWGNMDLTDGTGDAWFPDGHGGEFTEVDLTASYARKLGPLDASAGVTSYVLPAGSEFLNGSRGTTSELFAALGSDLFPGKLYGFYVLFAAYYDPHKVDGYYLNGGIFKGWDLAEKLRLHLGGSLGYSDKNHSLWTYGQAQEGFTDLRGTLALEYAIAENTTIAAGVAASTILHGVIRDWIRTRAIVERAPDGSLRRGIDTDTVWYTLGVHWRF
jgi:hypothetical protein